MNMDKTNVQYFDCICRTCMNEVVETGFSGECSNQQWQSIFDRIEFVPLPIAELLSSTMPQIEVKQSDELPKKICNDCLQQLKSMYRFQQMCLQCDHQMRELIAKKSITDTFVECEINIEQRIEVECANTLPEAPPTSAYDPLQSSCIKDEPCDDDKLDSECSDHETFLPATDVKNEVLPEKELNIPQLKKLEGRKDDLPVKTINKLDKPRFECEFCNRYFQKPESLHKHRLTHESHEDKVPRSHPCNLCEKIYNSRFALSRHKGMQHYGKNPKTPKKYPCEICNKNYTSTGALKNHIRTHTGERPFLCPECGKAFSTAGNMEQHRFRHSDIKAFECPYCPLKFRCKTDVATHKVIHSGNKPHVCDICGAGFYKPYDLKKHKRNHTGEKPYKCEYCEMRFVRMNHQRTHMLTHTGEKPYKCKYCERAFTQSGDHIKHLRTHLGDNVYGCSLCPAGFRLASELRLHFVTHKHDDEETRGRNLKALKEKEAMMELKLAGKEFQPTA